MRFFRTAGYQTILLSLIILVGFLLRIYGLEHGATFHPDERHIVMVALRLSLDNLNPEFFAYGTFPFYLLAGISYLLGNLDLYFVSYDGLFIVGRFISVIFGIAAGYLTYHLAFKLTRSRGAALLAAAFLMLNPFHIQLSRFYAFDGVLTTLNLAALVFILKISDKESRYLHFALGGLFLGLSVATKISSLSLFLPFGIALIFNLIDRKSYFSPALLLKGGVFCAAALIAFSVAEPYAWLEFERFWHDNMEQIQMVRGKWRPPYTVQYAGTTPYLYPLEQIVKYTVGLPIALLGIIAVLCACFKQLLKPSKKEIILLAWLLAVFAIVAGYQVKFPRYLLPLYPVFFIIAAGFLQQLSVKLRLQRGAVLMIAAVLVGYSALRSLAAVSIYGQDHVYEIASRWIYDNIPAGSRLLQGHWDDTLPLHLPGLSPALFHSHGPDHELPLYEPESPQKLNLVTQRTAMADYIIFPTPRLPGSITRLPDEFRDSNSYLKLLYSGNLGFKLIQTFKVYPKIGGYKINTDLADESLYVYDHPKVAIFKNELRLSAEELKLRIQTPILFGDLPTREEILLQNSGEQSTYTRSEQSSILSFLIWLAALEILSLASFPFLARLFPKAVDGAFGVSKIFGFFTFGMLTWLIPAYLPVSSNPAVCTLIFAALTFSFLILPRGRQGLIEAVLRHRRHIILVELLFVGGLIFFSLARAINPEIFWGEKAMDSAFLHFFTRLETLPPTDPWASGSNMRYYYLGSYIFGSLLKVTQIPAAIGYNLAIAAIPAFCLAALYSIFVNLTRRRIFSVISALCVVFVSNFEIVKLILIDKKPVNFDTFWAATRLFTPPGFTEYPLWSYLFADLHAHVIAQSVCAMVLVFIALYLSANSRLSRANRIVMAAVLGFCCSSLILFNTWDFIVYGVLIGLSLLVRNFSRYSALEGVKNILVEGITITFAGALLILPYTAATDPGAAASWGWNHSFEYNTLGQLVRHFGIWIALFILGAAALIIKCRGKCRTSGAAASLTCLLSVLPVALGLAGHYKGITPPPWDILALSSLLIFSSCLVLSAGEPKRRAAQYSGICLLTAGLMLGPIEVLFLMDRMNTVFKFYYTFWLIFATASLAVCSYLFERKKRYRAAGRVGLSVLQAAAILLLCVGIFGASINFIVMLSFQRTAGPRFTLNGQAYIKKQNPDEYALISWINERTAGVPNILEAHGDSYGPFTRIVMHTGVSTVLGWEHHVKQRGTAEREVLERKKDIQTIYSTPETREAEALLNKYEVDLIVVGELELQTYPGSGLKKFSENPALYPVVFRSGDTTLFMRAAALRQKDIGYKWR